mgnify:CR=1 FL=1
MSRRQLLAQPYNRYHLLKLWWVVQNLRQRQWQHKLTASYPTRTYISDSVNKLFTQGNIHQSQHNCFGRQSERLRPCWPRLKRPRLRGRCLRHQAYRWALRHKSLRWLLPDLPLRWGLDLYPHRSQWFDDLRCLQNSELRQMHFHNLSIVSNGFFPSR